MSAPPLGASLARLRRREDAVRSAAYSAAAGALALGFAVPVFAALETRTAARFTFALTLGAVFVALVVARARRSSLRRLAHLVDTRLSLDDRVVTALQYQHDADAASQFVVRDAEARLAAAAPADVFPLHLPPRLPVAAIAALAVSTLAVLGMQWTRGRSAAGAEPFALETASSSAGTASAAVTDAGTPARGSAQNAQAPVERGDAAVNRPGSGQADAGGGATASSPDAHGRSTPGSPAQGRRRQPGPVEAREAVEDRSAQAADATTAARNTGSAAADRPGGLRSPEGASSGRSARGVSAPARGGGRSRGSSGAPGTGLRPAAGARDPGGATYVHEYGEAVARAEAALAREDVPPGMRAYVRAYFQAIRPR
jgi:hypothetical protein